MPFHLCTAQQLINNHVDRSNRSPDANHRTDLSRSRATTIDVAMHHTAEDHGFYDAKCPAGRQNDVLNTLGQIFHERVGELHEWTTHTLKREINPSTGNPRYRLKISERGSVKNLDGKELSITVQLWISLSVSFFLLTCFSRRQTLQSEAGVEPATQCARQ